jgi:hypothetical protein
LKRAIEEYQRGVWKFVAGKVGKSAGGCKTKANPMGLRMCAKRAPNVQRGVECAQNVRKMCKEGGGVCENVREDGNGEVLVFLAPSS